MNTSATLLTDLDNTIYNWIDFYAPCFRAMVHVLSRTTHVEEAVITEQFKQVYTAFHSVEYPFAIQHLQLCRGLTTEQVRRLVYLGQLAFGRARRKYLKVYPGVRDTLMWARHNSIAIIGVTNAPLYLAWQRLKRLGLSSLFDGIVAGEDFPIPNNDIFAADYRSRSAATRQTVKWYFQSSLKKPDPGVYQEIIRALSLPSDNIWVIGDSLAKDIAPALSIGAYGIWARYGTIIEPKNFTTLLSITHWSEDQIGSTYRQDAVIPTAIIDSYAELQTIIPSKQMRLL